MVNNLTSFSFALFNTSQNHLEEFLNDFSKKKSIKLLL